MLKGYLLKGGLNKDNRYLNYIEEGLNWLIENSSKGYAGYCWGNDFDFASRAGYFPKELPTIVWTSHIQETFDLAYIATGNELYKDVVTSVADFICTDLDKIKDEAGFCFAYAPGINFPIHNSNLLGVAALLRSYKYTQNKNHLEAAKSACNWSVNKQNKDGSWYYGAIPMLHWIDNYHTGYNLDCMKLAHEIGGEDFIAMETITSTYRYWTEHLFDKDMAPRFYNHSSYPRDIQATAQAIESFCKYSTIDKEALNNAFAVFNWAVKNMLKENHSFAYRIYKNGKRNNLEAIHWGQSTMLSGMGHLSYYCARK